ncbi:hypothetical protein SS50377_27198 [Spironucleus salmonicida]|uniref:Uncharacterized protein n=1 Tax=Spironucleus salmonicida TaxID=348837 RepID=V6M6D7_9EUKA|nr:hypothetical protein SS50377_27198 [Spironucleus salmonicida]|eukprot:EST48964.1 Hypothetical protein SS50377_10812 [Spironucleus salmonicida]
MSPGEVKVKSINILRQDQTQTSFYVEKVELLKNGHIDSQCIITTGCFDNKPYAEEVFAVGCKIVGFSGKFIKNPTILITGNRRYAKYNFYLKGKFSYCTFTD